ncbi:S8 family serine peptidase [Streptomyces sp. NPDC001852]|uniref:S53 family peptidase n=1 Tax=Streptomyces sp. NPDC001852 TaxID=3364619 RepID=UPI0036BD5CF4
MSKQHVVLAGSARPAKAGATRLRDAAPQDQVRVTLTLRGPVVTGDRIPVERSQDAEKTKAVLERCGLTVDEVRLEPGSIVASGPVSAMNAAFAANLGIYESPDQGEFRGREGELRIPAELDGIVTGVFGLDQRRMAQRSAVKGSGFHGSFTPDDLAKMYNFPAGQAEGQRIGIAEFEGFFTADDLQSFCDRHGLQVPQVEVVPLNLEPLSAQEFQQLSPQQQQDEIDAAGEVMMDVQIVAGLCQAAQISVYFATFDQQGWIEMIDRVVADRPVAVSISWSRAEDNPGWSGNAIDEISKRLEGATKKGVTVCVSSGDDGAGHQSADGRAHVGFPSASPYVLSVGGTMIDASGQEVAWWEAPGRRTDHGGGSSGGGVSVHFARPDYQQHIKVDSLNPDGIRGRVVPDVAALAGRPLYDLTFLGELRPNGGTSASTPLWASLIARINALLPPEKQQRFLTPLLYQGGANGTPLGRAACRDIAAGHDNASNPPAVGYPVQEGYDAVTGWGVPDGVALLKGLH